MLNLYKPKTHSVLLIDIASTSVGIGLAGIREGHLPEIVFSIREPFGHTRDFDLSHLETAMLFNLKSALHKGLAGMPSLQKRGFPSALNHSLISFSSPWFISDLGVGGEELKTNLERKYGTPMEILDEEDGLVSVIEKSFLGRIEDEVIRYLGLKEGIGFQSFPLIFSRVISHAFQNIEPAIFVDMTGRTTDFLIKKGGRFHLTYSIPVGPKTLEHMEDGEEAWVRPWRTVRTNMDPILFSGDVFLISEPEYYEIGSKLLNMVLPQARIIPFHEENGFVREMVKPTSGGRTNERLAVLTTFSNLFL